MNMPHIVGNMPVLHKAKEPESGDLCGNITEFGVEEGSPEPAGHSKLRYMR